MVAEEAVEELVVSLRRLNAAAPIHRVIQGEIDPAVLFGVGPMDLSRRSPGFAEWLGDAAIHHEHHSEVQSLCLTAEAPLDWARFHDWLGWLRLADGQRLLRVKGVLNVIGEEGPIVVHGVQHIFHPPVSLPRWPDGDRRSRLVLIARDLDRKLVTETWQLVAQDANSSA
jgi:G3E family GTPase